MTGAGQRPTKFRCAIYTRKSSEEGLDQEFNSLNAQRESCQAYVLSQAGEGWVGLPEIYDDGGYSGGSMDRPALRRLLAEIESRRVDIVVVYKVDRLTRSLTDFAKMVDVFDRAGASFVSVTQAFNTTTSMGRLTLNVLLSFAQFEREVTGERIRDKLAASKKKGLWMGGNLPLGYDANGRTLAVNDAEAERVRHIFGRYLELGSVHLLCDELNAQGHRSKQWQSKAGRTIGGAPFSRGALFHVLSNRTYLGEIPHKDQSYPGQHRAIVDHDTFDLVQASLAKNAGQRRRARIGLGPLCPAAPLGGLIFDDRGNAMSPVSAKRGSGTTYRYYVSAALQQGRGNEAGSLPRVPADGVEQLVLDRARRLGGIDDNDEWASVRQILRRVTVARSRVQIEFHDDGNASTVVQDTLLSADMVTRDVGMVTVEVAVSLKRRGGDKTIFGPSGAPAVDRPAVDRVLLRTLIMAESWKRDLVAGRAASLTAIARSKGLQISHCERAIRLAFLAPDLKRAILEGRTPAGLVLQAVREDGLPDLWSDQRAVAHRARGL